MMPSACGARTPSLPTCVPVSTTGFGAACATVAGASAVPARTPRVAMSFLLNMVMAFRGGDVSGGMTPTPRPWLAGCPELLGGGVPAAGAPYHFSSKRGRTAMTHRSSGSAPPENAWAARARCSTASSSPRSVELAEEQADAALAERLEAPARRPRVGEPVGVEQDPFVGEGGVPDLEVGDLRGDAERMAGPQVADRLPVGQ